jgi:hypothetical protein
MPQSVKFYRINKKVIADLYGSFRSYKDFSQNSIAEWVDQFDGLDGSLALKILSRVTYLNQARMITAFKSIHRQLIELLDGELSNCYFSGYGRAGQSGQEMLYRYKMANSLRNSELETHLVGPSQIQGLLGKGKPIIIFLDDFVGTGGEAVEAWQGRPNSPDFSLNQVVPPNADFYLAVPIAFQSGVDKIHSEPRLKVLAWRVMGERDRVLSTANTYFSGDEKKKIKQYCLRTGCPFPYGYGDLQATVVFDHNCPNDDISILWHSGEQWQGLFPRD